MPTDKLFTGQRLDGTGLYYYGARYYDPAIGRFISPDTVVQISPGLNAVSYQLTVNIIPLGLGSVSNFQTSPPQAFLAVPMNPQALNRYSYVLNNPLRYTDPTGYFDLGKVIAGIIIIVAVDIGLMGPIVLATALNPGLVPVAVAVHEFVARPIEVIAAALIIAGALEQEPNEPQLPLEAPEGSGQDPSGGNSGPDWYYDPETGEWMLIY